MMATGIANIFVMNAQSGKCDLATVILSRSTSVDDLVHIRSTKEAAHIEGDNVAVGNRWARHFALW
jgi:hypothetical protein